LRNSVGTGAAIGRYFSSFTPMPNALLFGKP
jgi:hypothetical protein